MGRSRSGARRPTGGPARGTAGCSGGCRRRRNRRCAPTARRGGGAGPAPAGPGWGGTTPGPGSPSRPPAPNGRAGAGYGGLFWRLPPTQEPSVRTDRAAGEGAVHSSVGSWLVWHDPGAGFTLALAGADDATRVDPWFVRLHEYPGIGSQLAESEPLLLEPGGSATRGWRALVADGALEDDAVQRWAAETS